MNNKLEHLCFDIGIIQETYQKGEKKINIFTKNWKSILSKRSLIEKSQCSMDPSPCTNTVRGILMKDI